MKNISLLKFIFLIHLIAFSAYFLYHFKYKTQSKEIQSHLIDSNGDNKNNLEVKPIGIKIEEENNPISNQDTTSLDNENFKDDTIENIITRFGINYVVPTEGLSVLQLIIQENRDDLFIKHISQIKNIDHQNNIGATALVMAASSSDLEYTRELLKRGANPNIKFNKREFSILMDAAMEGNLELITMLLEHGANINTTDNTGKSALHYSCIEGHLKVTELLISKGAQKNLKDLNNLSCLDYLIKNKHTHLYDLLK